METENQEPMPRRREDILTQARERIARIRAAPEQAARLRLAIANYRQARKLMRPSEKKTERLIDAETTHEP
jgi:hypothetical protein